MSNLLEKIKSGEFHRHAVVRSTAALLVVQVSAYAAPFLVLPYLSRILTTDHFGLIAYATTFNWYFITIVEYGFNLTATRRIAIHANDPEKISKIFSSVMAAKALLTVLSFFLMLAVVLLSPKLRPNLALFCLSYLAVVGDLLFPLWLFQGLQKMETLVWRDLTAKVVSMLLIFAFVHKDSDYMWAAGFQASSLLIAGVVGLITVPFTTTARFVAPSKAEVFTALREGWPVFLSMAAMALSSTTNIVFLMFRSGPTDVAYYSSANRLVVAVRTLVSPLVTALYPYISHMAANSRENATEFINKYLRLMAAPFLGASLALCLGAPLIIRLMYSQKYLPSIPIMQILSFGVFLLAVQHMYSTFYMLALGYQKEWSRLVLQATALNFAVLVPLIYLLWPPVALATTSLIVDLFVAGMGYRFFVKTSTLAPQAVAA